MVYRQLGKCQLVKVKDVTKCFSFYYITGIDSKNLTLGFDGRRHGLNVPLNPGCSDAKIFRTEDFRIISQINLIFQIKQE